METFVLMVWIIFKFLIYFKCYRYLTLYIFEYFFSKISIFESILLDDR